MPSWLDAGPGHELAERHEIGEIPIGHPAAAFDELGAEIADMRDWPAERSAAEAEENQKDFQNRSSPSPNPLRPGEGASRRAS